MIVGNDIASFQGNIDYDLYSHNSNFVIIKTSEGKGFIDPKFSRNQAEARRVGLALGYYHFARPDLGNSPQSEADYFLLTIGNLRDGEILCLDYEPNWPGGDAVGWCKAFLDRVYSITKVKPLIYLNKSQVKSFNWQPIVDAGYGLWLACYDDNVQTGAWDILAMQQWTSSQGVPGISGNVDGDRFFGSVEQFKAYGYKRPAQPSTSPSASYSRSQSASASPSISPSQSPSASPSPTIEIPPVMPEHDKYLNLMVLLNLKWTWVGNNAWYKRLAACRKIINA